jgi:galactose mutarotase-like enzyme
MDFITLKNTTANGVPLEATFLPNRGMNLMSYKWGNLEIIDQSTKGEFERRFAGLGPLIGPHFHRRKPHLVSKMDPVKFPFVAKLKPEEQSDPFSHGIGRYAPWKATYTETSVRAELSGKDTWNDVPLSLLEGQNFQMTFHVNLTKQGLELKLSVVSDADSIVGIHYYYPLPQGKGTIISRVQKTYIANNERKPLPQDWKIDEQNFLRYELDHDIDTDFTFFPYPDPLQGKITLETKTHNLVTTYSCTSQENSWQLWHPKGGSFVCIEPVSSQNPRHPNLTVSSINIRLEIA